MLIVVISLLTFGIPMIMLNMERKVHEEREVIESVSPFWLPNIMLNQYLLALGDFQIEDFDNGSQTGLCYMFFVLATLISQVTMLNMLIAIMGDTFEHIIENKDLNSVKTKIEVMAELVNNIYTEGEVDEERFLFVITPDEDEQGDD